MDPNCLDDNMEGIQDESSEKLLSPSSSDAETFGELQVLPHVGEEYQAVIPPLIGEFKSALIIVKSTDSELNVNAQNSLVLGLPIPLMRARNGVENKNGTLEAENSEGSQITANNDYAEPKVEHPDNVLEDHRIRISKLEVMDIDLVLPCALKSMPDQLERGVSFLPGSLDESWNDVERDCFLLGLYIFGKDLILVKKFVDSKDMGDILAFYYGKFYRSDEYHRWSECRKLKNRQFIHGQRIFTGWRHQELLSRVFSHVSEECKSMVLEVSRRFGEGKMSFEEYVLTLKNTVGISILIEAVGVGKGKQDLTGTTMEPPKANRVNSGHSEIPSGKACSSLTSADIIKFLTGGFRLSKARSSDIFWEAVWPRLLARGWHSEQPKDQGHLGSKNPLVFLIPAVKKFSRRRLVKGNHYFDSITDVLNKVALDPGLLEIEVEGTQGTANKEENGWDPSITQPPPDLSNKKRNCYLQLRNSNCNQDLMKFTIVDTSTIQEAQQPKVRELRSLPVEIAGACTTPSSISSESEHDASEDSEDEAEETKISHATGDMIDRGACSESSDCVNSNMNTGMTKTSDRTNVAVGNHEYHSEIVLGKKQQRKSTKYRFSRKISPGHLEYLAPITKRQDVTSCLQGESSCSIENISAVRKPTEDESHCRSNSLDACDDMNSQIRPPQNLSPASSLAKGSPDGSNEGFITENLLAREASPEKPQPFELFDLNYPEVSLDFEAEEPVITDMVQNNDNSCADKSSVPSETSMLSEPLKLHDVEARPDQNPIVSNRRQSTRNRPLTTKALEALACGFFNPKRKRKVSADLEMGSHHHQDMLIELGCSCKNDLALVHYACALKWFVNHGSTVCEICGQVAKNIRTADLKKVVVSLKDYEALRERTAIGDPNPAQVHSSSGVDPDAIAAIRRQRLSEISLWFSPHSNSNNYNNNSAALSQVVSEQSLNTITEDIIPAENPATKWAVEGTGILLATGLLTVTLAWLIAPRVGKKTAKSGLHILLGGICALTVVVFFRFIVLTRIKYGPARYWAILFVFWFLVFGIWASRTHAAHTT